MKPAWRKGEPRAEGWSWWREEAFAHSDAPGWPSTANPGDSSVIWSNKLSSAVGFSDGQSVTMCSWALHHSVHFWALSCLTVYHRLLKSQEVCLAQGSTKHSEADTASLNSFETIKCAHAKTVVHVLDYHGLHFHCIDATMPPLYFSNLLYLKFKKVQCQKTSKFFVQLYTVLPIWTHPPTPAQLLFYSKNIL